MGISSVTKIHIVFEMDYVTRSATYPAVLQVDALNVKNLYGSNISGTWVRESSTGMTTVTIPIEQASAIQVGKESCASSVPARIALSWTPSSGTTTISAIELVSTYNVPSLIMVGAFVMTKNGGIVTLPRETWGSGRASVAFQQSGIYSATNAHRTVTFQCDTPVSNLVWDTPTTNRFPFGGRLNACFVLKNQFGTPTDGIVMITPKLTADGYNRTSYPPTDVYRVVAGQQVKLDRRAEGIYSVVAIPAGVDSGSAVALDIELRPIQAVVT